MTTHRDLVLLAWGAYSGSKTDRYMYFAEMLALDPPETIVALCRRGMAATTIDERSAVCEALLVALGEPVP